MGKDKYSVAFIIAHKYFRGYPSYLKYYIENIIKFYGDNALVLVVDNNSLYKEDIFNDIPDRENTVYLDNNIDCKFELGAYQVGINYILENDLLDKYEFYVCTQDNFIIKNKYDFNILLDTDATACPINSWKPDGACGGIVRQVLSSIGLYNNLDKMTFCWCSSFVVSRLKLEQLYGYLQKIVITVRHQSCASERYLARILWELNNYKNTDIDGGLDELKRDYYDCWTVDPYADANSFFVKKVQQKTEKTVDQ